MKVAVVIDYRLFKALLESHLDVNHEDADALQHLYKAIWENILRVSSYDPFKEDLKRADGRYEFEDGELIDIIEMD